MRCIWPLGSGSRKSERSPVSPVQIGMANKDEMYRTGDSSLLFGAFCFLSLPIKKSHPIKIYTIFYLPTVCYTIVSAI